MKVSRTIRHTAQYTALVDILFATIGIFVIVFALQDLDPPQELLSAPYNHLIMCGAERQLTFTSAATGATSDFTPDDLDAGMVEERLVGGGRVLVALSGDCLVGDGGPSVAAALRAIETTLSERKTTALTPITLFEFAPLGEDDAGPEALLARFLSGAAL